MGKEIGVWNMIKRRQLGLGPFAGGVIAGMWGFDILFGVGVSVLVMSLIPIYFMEKHKHEDGVGFGDLVLFGKMRNKVCCRFGVRDHGWCVCLDMAIVCFYCDWELKSWEQ